MATKVPTLYEWLGGAEPLSQLIDRFYQKVPADPLLAPLFAGMSPDHFHHVAIFLAEVLGGPADYTAHHGGHANMIRHHLGKGITDQQRKRWATLLLETADELNLPADPEFRSALVAYLEWGSRLAVINSALPADAPVEQAPMPAWSWGVPGGPYQPDAPEASGDSKV
ncbi:MAG TPA: group II truncated hemoglobin [Edaphobacter sp.]|nr:group II truncated hemoglobin [Edaphobacter sp.]